MTKQELIKTRIDRLTEPQLDQLAQFLDRECTIENPKAISVNGLTVAEEQAMLKDLEDAKKGIGVSPAFANIEDGLKWLKDPANAV